MDNHPIPQDVTGFQFRLIGDMTIKQFAYVAIAGVLVVILWYLPVFILIKAFLIPLFGLTGLALAFLPVEGRPLDLMASNFLKALFTPNQYVFQKAGGGLSFLNLPQDTYFQPAAKDSNHPHPEDDLRKKELLASYLNQTDHVSKNPLDSKETQYLTGLFSTQPTSPVTALPPAPLQPQAVAQDAAQATAIQLSSAPQPPTTTQDISIPHTAPVQIQEPAKNEPAQAANSDSEEALEKQAEAVQHELEAAKIKEATQKSTEEGIAAHEKVIELDKKLQDIYSEKQRLEQELLELKKQLGKSNDQAKTPTQAVEKAETQNVRKIPQSMSKKAGMPTPPDVPNLLMGIVKDSRGNVLPNILVEVKDQQGNPVRAFKTNPLGQFASATTLQNGVYTLAFEDPQKQHRFELIELIVNDQIIQPLEIISVDAREELRQQLFT